MTLKIPHGSWEGGSEMLLRCCTCDSSSFTIRQKIGEGIVRNGGFGEAMGDSGRGQVLLTVQVLTCERCWYHQFFCLSSLLLALLSSGYGDAFLLPDGHNPPGAEA